MPTTFGTISAINGSTLTVTLPNNSTQDVAFGANTKVVTLQSSAVSSLASGDTVAVIANQLPDGTLRATQIQMYTPQLWAFALKGQIPGPTGQLTINGSLTAVSTGTQPTTITVAYGNTMSTINVPSGAGVYQMTAGDPAQLAVGQKVDIDGYANSTGTVAAATIEISAG